GEFLAPIVARQDLRFVPHLESGPLEDVGDLPCQGVIRECVADKDFHTLTPSATSVNPECAFFLRFSSSFPFSFFLCFSLCFPATHCRCGRSTASRIASAAFMWPNCC